MVPQRSSRPSLAPQPHSLFCMDLERSCSNDASELLLRIITSGGWSGSPPLKRYLPPLRRRSSRCGKGWAIIPGRATSMQLPAFWSKNTTGLCPPTAPLFRRSRGLRPYTIGAILSFGFHQRAAAVDGNVIRVLTRYYAIEEDVRKERYPEKNMEIAEDILPEGEPWLIVEGLIELGASVCKREANCWACPLRTGCSAFKRGIQEELPKKGRKVEIYLPLPRCLCHNA